VLQRPGKLDHVGRAVGDRSREPHQAVGLIVGRTAGGGEVEELEVQLVARMAAQRALAGAGGTEQEDERRRCGHGRTATLAG
jgi:hypothetical protein